MMTTLYKARLKAEAGDNPTSNQQAALTRCGNKITQLRTLVLEVLKATDQLHLLPAVMEGYVPVTDE